MDVKLLEQELASIPRNPSQKLINTKDDIGRIPEEQYAMIQKFAKNHIDSFDYFINEGLKTGIKHLRPFEYQLPNNKRISIEIIGHRLCYPAIDQECVAKTSELYPCECRMRGKTYKGRLYLEFLWKVDDKVQQNFDELVGEVPIMVKSQLCNLRGKTPKQLIQHFEDAEEIGGYFIVNGNERLIRMLIAQRRNYPLAITRNSWKDSGPFFSEYGISMRCVGGSQIGQNMVLHYLTNGTAKLKIFYNARQIFLPLVLVMRALVEYTDLKIYKRLVRGNEHNSFYKSCIISMIRLVKEQSITSKTSALDYIGEKFRVQCQLPEWYTDYEVGEHLMKTSVAVHLDKDEDKFNCLVMMMRKLFALAKNECAIESPDNPMFHEIHSSGQILFTLLIERIEQFLTGLKMCLDIHLKKLEKSNKEFKLDKEFILRMLRLRYGTIVRPLDYLLATGNLQSTSGLGLMQKVGMTVMAEKINYLRFVSHFRSVHRGAFFAKMRTTACRKLYPEAWGFLCPVHTPDGTPCGLLNHVTETCVITSKTNDTEPIDKFLNSQSIIIPVDTEDMSIPFKEYYDITIDGRLIGYVHHCTAKELIDDLRKYKVKQTKALPIDMEICLIPKTAHPTQYPGVYIFTNISRMMRPVFNIKSKAIEWIGTFEQVYMDICVNEAEAISGRTTHRELAETSFLSVMAALIPYPDFNQSPRNMYCCQMTKQTMGSSSHTLKYRCDNKMYNIETPQSPLIRPAIYDHYHLDEFPLGTNALVAVISYTGYDMEDAMIINKAAAERGFTHGSIMKTLVINLREVGNVRLTKEQMYLFGYLDDVDKKLIKDKIDVDGLPYIGTKLNMDDPICCYYDISNRVTKIEKYKSSEQAHVLDVKLLGSDDGKDLLQKVAITLWMARRPFVGDKYANRHGQKGVCSLLWPEEDMPFTESGMKPDIIFNPHGYPSRMTIGMMLESMSGKASAMRGEAMDATPFRFSESDIASDFYGKMLQESGFNYYGTERMYSGVDGHELRAEIFIGLVYYIRLRHMVSDKYQVRSSGPIDQITHQPVKGRKRGGGVRFGEMERDSLLAHGASFLLQDRLVNCSDGGVTYACVKCGSIISPSLEIQDTDLIKKMVDSDGKVIVSNQQLKEIKRQWRCRLCKSRKEIRPIYLPYVIRYLTAELASVNIALRLDIKDAVGSNV